MIEELITFLKKLKLLKEEMIMAFHIHGTARTTWVGEPRIDTYGGTQVKRLLFKCVSNRDYASTVTKADGSTEKDHAPDFMLCECRGVFADTLINYGTARDSNGKLISRLFEFDGTVETYTTTRNYPFTYAGADGTPVQTALEVKDVEQWIIKVQRMKFLDKKPVPTVNANMQDGQTGFSTSARNAFKNNNNQPYVGQGQNQQQYYQGQPQVQGNENPIMNPPQPQPDNTAMPQMPPMENQNQVQPQVNQGQTGQPQVNVQNQPQGQPVPQQNGYVPQAPQVPEGFQGEGTPF